MPEIKNKSRFKPDGSSLSFWRRTRKLDIQIGAISLPGYFSDDLGKDTWTVPIIVVGELLGLCLIIYGSSSGGALFAIAGVFAAVLCIALDFLLAIKKTDKEAKKCEINSKIILEEDEKIKDQLKLELEKGKAKDILIFISLFVISLIKIFAIILLQVFDSPVLYGLIYAIFLVIIYVHFNHTGFLIAHLVTRFLFKYDYNNKYNKTNPVCIVGPPIERQLLLPDNLSKKKIVDRENSIELIDPENDLRKIKITILGILTDDELKNLIKSENPTNQMFLFKELRRIQTDQG